MFSTSRIPLSVIWHMVFRHEYKNIHEYDRNYIKNLTFKSYKTLNRVLELSISYFYGILDNKNKCVRRIYGKNTICLFAKQGGFFFELI